MRRKATVTSEGASIRPPPVEKRASRDSPTASVVSLSLSASIPMTSSVTAIVLDRWPFERAMDRVPAAASTSPRPSLLASHVLSPHEHMRPNRHLACHLMGERGEYLAASEKNASTSDDFRR